MASVLAVTLIAAALAATVLSYREAIEAHKLAAAAIAETSVSHAAETFLSREREAMNEYLFNPRGSLRAKISDNQKGFLTSISQVGHHEPEEALLVQRAIVANDQFLEIFTARSHRSGETIASFRRLDAELDTGEKDVLAPLHALRSLNDAETREVARSSETSNQRALLFAIFAGALAVAGGFVFALYAVRLVKNIGSRNERLHELDQMKDDFVASVSHELRTPLTSIRGYLELLREGEAGALTDEQHQFVSIVERNADRLLRLVGDLLFVAQVEAGKITLDPGPTDVEDLVRRAVDAARPAATEKGIYLELDLDALGELHADRARLEQVLDNLISNALKFTPPGGHVAVRTSRHADGVAIEVSDDGMGMSEEDQGQLFQRFFRTTSASEQAIQGTGLGLSIVKAIVEAHDGVITVESVAGEGSVFRVELPPALASEPLVA